MSPLFYGRFLQIASKFTRISIRRRKASRRTSNQVTNARLQQHSNSAHFRACLTPRHAHRRLFKHLVNGNTPTLALQRACAPNNNNCNTKSAQRARSAANKMQATKPALLIAY